MSTPPVDSEIVHVLYQMEVSADRDNDHTIPEGYAPCTDVAPPTPGTRLWYLFALVDGTRPIPGFHPALWPEVQVLDVHSVPIPDGAHVYATAARCNARHGIPICPMLSADTTGNVLHLLNPLGCPDAISCWRLFVADAVQ